MKVNILSMCNLTRQRKKMPVTCSRCGDEYVPMLESDEIEGLCPACLFDPEREENYCSH
jgi:NMD protein affecting ribosome stability and mRNA decay